MTMSVTGYCINRKSRGLMNMTFDLVERSGFESVRDYANNSVLRFTDDTQSFDHYKLQFKKCYNLKNEGT